MAIREVNSLLSFTEDRKIYPVFVSVENIPMALGVLKQAGLKECPVILAVTGASIASNVIMAVEDAARKSCVAVAIVAWDIRTLDQAHDAVRQGCSGVFVAKDLSAAIQEEIQGLSRSCGVMLESVAYLETRVQNVGSGLEKFVLQGFSKSPADWRQINRQIESATEAYMDGVLNTSESKGQGLAAAQQCKPWNPVEHLIVYNTTVDDAKSEEIAAHGREVLDKIPGVRATWSGRAVKRDAAYRWCWLVRFAHPAVIDSYREHPDHVAYADDYFRPVAGDRVSIDYSLYGPEDH